MMKRRRVDRIKNVSSKKNCSLDWDRCQDGFDTDIINQVQRSSSRKSLGTSNKKSKAKLLSAERLGSQEDDIDISWSSSDSDSDSDVHPLVFESPDASPELIRRLDKDEPSKQVYEQISVTSQNYEVPEVLISDYESASDNENDQIGETSMSNTQQTSESFSISSTSSSLPSNSLPSGMDIKKVSPKKGSNLVNQLKQQMQSPQATGENELLDSSKKKGKFLKGGLADRLQKLISRERSSVAMWKHRAIDLKNNASTKALTLSLQKVHISCGIYISECLDISSNDEGQQKVLHVLFSTPTARQLHIAEGSIIIVYPPWQCLNIPAYSEPILLCTHYCQLVGDESESSKEAHTSTYHTARRKMLFDATPSADPLTVRPILEEVTIQQIGAFDEDDQASDSILDSIADSSGHSTKGMCIRATVQRVCCYNAKKTEELDISVKTNQQWFLILQDIRGVFCEMRLPDGCCNNDTWRECLDGETKTFIFRGAKVLQRTNRSRSVRLFSMMDSMWPPCDDILLAGFNSQSESSEGTRSLPAPCFCYTLTIDSQHNTLKRSKKQHAIYKRSRVCKLMDIKNMASRFSINAKVLYITHISTDRHALKRIYITDPSLQKSICEQLEGHSSESSDLTCLTYRCLLLEQSCTVESDLIGHVIMFKDVFVENDGILHADNYSRVLRVAESQFESIRVHLEPLHVDSNQLDLVSVQGEIVGADESSAYHWPVCNRCGSDKLHGVSALNDQFYCEVCQVDKVTTRTKVFLEVYIKCKTFDKSHIKIQLQQSSIERILPPITDEIMLQGFDLHSIMCKMLGPINAIVRKASNQFVLEEIQI